MKITIEGNTVDGSARSTLNVVLSGARGPAGEQGDPGQGGEWGTIVGDITEQTDLYNALQGKVPYTGATQDVNLGEFGLLTGNVEFDTTPTNAPTTAGSMSWNDTDGTVNLVLKGGNVISKLGETQHIRAYNNTGTAIARGKVVYVSGAQGQRLTVALADADTEILSKDTIGFTAESIADGAEGFVMIAGMLSNMNTSGMANGATVFLSQTAGGYTTTPPVDPAHLVILGFIVNGGSGGAGSIYVKVDNGYELEELHGVADAAKVTPVAADALLLRDSADNNLWKRLTWTNALAGVKTHMDTFKGVAGGYASLDGSGKIPSTELPSYVDDVVEAANFAALPVTGETGKIYVTLDTNKVYRWTGSVYVEVSAGGASAWGAITGTLSNQTDLQSALDAKQDDIILTTTGTSGAATLVGSTLNIPQYQSVLTNPVTGTGTAGQVAYWDGTTMQTGSNNLFWDNANGRLGVGLNTGLTARTHVRGSGTTSATTALLVQNSTPTELLKITDDGAASIGKNLSATTQSTASISVTSGDTNTGIAIVTKGTGAITAQIPDNTATGGNGRGGNAVDFQMVRSNAENVASRQYSVILSGSNNRASGSHSIVSNGNENFATGNFSTIIGGQQNIAAIDYASTFSSFRANAYLYGQKAFSSGAFTSNTPTGDSQLSFLFYRRAITGTAQTELFLDGSSIRSIIALPGGATNARVWNSTIQVVAIVATAGAGGLVINECFMGTYGCGIKRVGTTTSLVGTVTTEWEKSDTNMATSVVTIDADDTNESLRIQFTPPTTADGTTVIRVVATAYLTEVGR